MKAFLQNLNFAWGYFVLGKHKSLPPTATAWDSMVLAASEEWVDETEFRFTVSLPYTATYDELVSFILSEAVRSPDLPSLQRQLSIRFALTEKEALTAMDRALGGVVRAASLNPAAQPNTEIDPVASHAFLQAYRDPSIIDSIFPDWRNWKPGCYSV